VWVDSPNDWRDKLVLTYNNRIATDGVGAQLHRIYGTYAISRFLGASYLHSPVARVDYQGLSPLEKRTHDPGFHEEFNRLLYMKSDPLPPRLHQINMVHITVDDVKQLVARFDAGETEGKPWLARLNTPFGIADQFPECYEVCKEISPFATVPTGPAVRVAIHVRRGELFAVDSHRMLPNSFYVQVGRTLARVLQQRGLDYRIELHTEVASKAFVLRPDERGISHRIDAPVLLRPEMNELEEFDALPNLVHCINEPAIDCLRQLATAHILVMSRSSFSYVAAILNLRGLVLSHPFWHTLLPSWVEVDATGQFDLEKFEGALEDLRAQSQT
jgi:hypothetical protein